MQPSHCWPRAQGSLVERAAISQGPPECKCEALQASVCSKWGSEPCPVKGVLHLHSSLFHPSLHAPRQGLHALAFSVLIPVLCALQALSPFPLSVVRLVTISDEAERHLSQGAFRAPPEQEPIPTCAVLAHITAFCLCLYHGTTQCCFYLFIFHMYLCPDYIWSSWRAGNTLRFFKIHFEHPVAFLCAWHIF